MAKSANVAARMADVQPLRTLRYDLSAVGSLDAVAAPPYDVIDPPLRAELAAKRIKDKAKHRKGDRAEKHAITFFAKDYR